MHMLFPHSSELAIPQIEMQRAPLSVSKIGTQANHHQHKVKLDVHEDACTRMISQIVIRVSELAFWSVRRVEMAPRCIETRRALIITLNGPTPHLRNAIPYEIKLSSVLSGRIVTRH